MPWCRLVAHSASERMKQTADQRKIPVPSRISTSVSDWSGAHEVTPPIKFRSFDMGARAAVACLKVDMV